MSNHKSVESFPIQYGEGRVLFYVACSLYLLLVVSFLGMFPKMLQLIIASFALFATLVLSFRNLTQSVYLTALVTHIGLIIRFNVDPFGMISLGDLFLLLISFSFIFKRLKHGFYGGPIKDCFVILFPLFLVSVLFSPDVKRVLPGAISVLQIVLVYFLVINEIRTWDQARMLINMILITVIAAAFLHVFFYLRGISLLLSGESATSLLRGDEILNLFDDKTQSLLFVKSSYFFSLIPASVTAIVLGCRYLFLQRKFRLSILGFRFIAMTLAIISSLVSGDRTPLVAGGLVCIMIVLERMRLHPKSGKHLLRFGIAIIGIMVAGYVGLAAQRQILSQEKYSSFREKFAYESGTSVMERLLMLKAIPHKVIEFPKEFILGVGPDLSYRAPDNSVISSLMYIEAINFQPPSFHNFFIDYIFQLGIFSFLIVSYAIAVTLIRLIKSIRLSSDDLIYDCFFTICGWLILWSSHATGWSKAVIIFAQLFALAHLVSSGRLVGRRDLSQKLEKNLYMQYLRET